MSLLPPHTLFSTCLCVLGGDKVLLNFRQDNPVSPSLSLTPPFHTLFSVMCVSGGDQVLLSDRTTIHLPQGAPSPSFPPHIWFSTCLCVLGGDKVLLNFRQDNPADQVELNAVLRSLALPELTVTDQSDTRNEGESTNETAPSCSTGT
jgi:hypothetical protein